MSFLVFFLRLHDGFYVAAKAFKFSPFHGTAFEELAILLHREIGPVVGSHIAQGFGGMEVGLLRDLGKAVPRAGLGTAVATIDTLSHLCARLLGEVATVFDGEIRQTAACVERTVAEQRPRRAGIETTAAIAATRRHGAVIGIGLAAEDEFAEEEIGAGLRDDELSATSLPTEATSHGPIAFIDGSGVAKGTPIGVFFQREGRHETAEALAHEVVIVAAAGIAGKGVTIGREGLVGVIIHGQRHHCFRALNEQLRIEALLKIVGQIGHIGLASGFEPAAIMRGGSLGQRGGRGEAACRKAEAGCLGFHCIGRKDFFHVKLESEFCL